MERLQLTGANRHRTPEALSTLSAIVIDGVDIRVDNAAIHGKSWPERGIRFVRDPDEVPNPRRVVVVWVTLRRHPAGLGINGLAACTMQIDAEAGVGYKNLADQVNKMDYAVKGRILLDLLTPEEHNMLGAFLKAQRAELWENAQEAVWAQWLSPEEYAPMKERMEAVETQREEIRRKAEAAVGESDPEPPKGLKPRYEPRQESGHDG